MRLQDLSSYCGGYRSGGPAHRVQALGGEESGWQGPALRVQVQARGEEGSDGRYPGRDDYELLRLQLRRQGSRDWWRRQAGTSNSRNVNSLPGEARWKRLRFGCCNFESSGGAFGDLVVPPDRTFLRTSRDSRRCGSSFRPKRTSCAGRTLRCVGRIIAAQRGRRAG